jgi:hypothetical protein
MKVVAESAVYSLYTMAKSAVYSLYTMAESAVYSLYTMAESAVGWVGGLRVAGWIGRSVGWLVGWFSK